jgi:hypothetical protein
MKVGKPMKKMGMIGLAISITLAICLTGCFSGKKVNLGERYDSDKISQWISFADSDEFGVSLDSYFKDASETQFVIHEETAIAIAEAVIKEIYPSDGYKVVKLSSYEKALYYKAENCWEVWLRKKPSRLGAILVYIDVNSGAIKAIVPLSAFGY